MESCFSFLFLLVLLTVVPCMGHTHPELYWKTMLPNTRMPKALSDLVQPDFLTSLKSHNGKPLPPQVKFSGYGLERVASSNHPNSDSPNPFFLKKNMCVGTKFKLRFPKTTESPFLIREVAETYPFSSKQLLEILARFSIKAETMEATLIKNTIKDCEALGIKGEQRVCTTSLESMVDLVTTKMGNNDVAARSTVIQEGNDSNYWQVSTMLNKSPHDRNIIICHKQTYPYAVFICHSTNDLKLYELGLASSNGSANAIAVCHNDTSAWNPNYLAFQLLKVKPGTPICHFLPQDDVVWFKIMLD